MTHSIADYRNKYFGNQKRFPGGRFCVGKCLCWVMIYNPYQLQCPLKFSLHSAYDIFWRDIRQMAMSGVVVS